MYLTTHENNITEIAFLHRVRSISYPPRKAMRCSWPCGWSTTSMKTCKNSWCETWRSNEILFSQNWLMLIYIYIYSSGFTEFPVLIVRHHQMNLWFYSLTRLKMRSCLRCECKSARWRKGDIKLFHNMFLSTSWYSLVASRAVYRRTPGRICVDRCNRDSLVCAVHCSCAPDLLEVLQHWWPLPHLAVLVS